MTSIVTSISGQFSKSLVIGTLLPVTVYVILMRIVVLPFYPASEPVFKSVRNLGTEWEVLAGLLITVVASGLLYMFNGNLIRLLEGYPWKDGWLGQKLIARQAIEFEAAKGRRRALRPLEDALQSAQDPNLDTYASDAHSGWSRAGGIYNESFPESKHLVLPTRLGNTIRAFERYPARRYGLAPIAMWPRLTAVIGDNHAAMMDDAKTSFDFALNAAFVSWLFGVSMLISGAAHAGEISAQTLWFLDGPLWWLAGIICSFGLALLFYRSSIGLAISWGELVAAAFDLYRGALLKQLGYDSIPETVDDEKALWVGISNWIRRDDLPFSAGMARKEPDVPGVIATPVPWPQKPVNIDLIRASGPPRVDGSVEITLIAANTDPVRPARTVVVTDRIPDGFELIHQSVSVRIANLPVPLTMTGTNPYRFKIGDLQAHQTAAITYRMFKR